MATGNMLNIELKWGYRILLVNIRINVHVKERIGNWMHSIIVLINFIMELLKGYGGMYIRQCKMYKCKGKRQNKRRNKRKIETITII